MTHILVLEPFGGGSHAAFYEQWMEQSRNRFTVLSLPPVHWKWRSRHASLTLAEQTNALARAGNHFDAIFCSEMLNVPEWRGFVDNAVRDLPLIAYFHENQFTYPLSAGQQTDYHFAYSNCLTAIAADKVWFNSEFHLREFREAAFAWLRRMPDFKHLDSLADALKDAVVHPPGISLPSAHEIQSEKDDSIPTIGWVSRWEHDKSPETFVDAIISLVDQEMQFKLCLLGQQFSQTPPSLSKLLKVAGPRIRHCGYAQTRQEYWQCLSTMDIVVSAAKHEFFGVGIVEAIAAGAFPLLPNRLAYPEVLGLDEHPSRSQHFYGSNDDELTGALLKLLRSEAWRESWKPSPPEDASHAHQHTPIQQHALTYNWKRLAPKYDQAVDDLVNSNVGCR